MLPETLISEERDEKGYKSLLKTYKFGFSHILKPSHSLDYLEKTLLESIGQPLQYPILSFLVFIGTVCSKVKKAKPFLLRMNST